MWGPNWSPFNINQTITLFEESWNTNYDTGNAGIFSIAGQSFGAALSGSFSGLIGSSISLTGFTSGKLDVDYPVDIKLTKPNDLSYDAGDQVTLQTAYNVTNGWTLDTYYPSVGEARWDVYFQMAGDATATLCAFGCTSIPIIPSFNTGLINVNIFTANASGIWYLGPANWLAPDLPPAPNSIFPFAKPPNSGPCNAPSCLLWQCHVPFVPMELPDVGYGLSGSLTIPYVETDPYIGATAATTAPPAGQHDITACGDSTYLNLNLEILQLIGGVLENFEIPQVEAVGIVLSNLSGSYELPGGYAEVTWNFFSASLDVNITNKQCFDFTPKIYGQFEFPVPVTYSKTNASGAPDGSGTSTIINVEIGGNLTYNYPCYFEEIDIKPTYSIDGVIRNHTWDEISFDFLASAFEFGLDVPQVTVVPGFTIPEICIDIPYPCPSWSCAWCWCTSTQCTPEIVVPPIVFGGWNFGIGPLWSTTIPLGVISYDWFDQTWSLGGFSSYGYLDDPSFIFSMAAKPLEISSTTTDILCYGDNTGAIDVTVSALSHAYPYTYQWTPGTFGSISSGNTFGLSGIPAGPYEVMVYDANGCELFTGGTIMEPGQPLSLYYDKVDKLCNGGPNSGSIDITVQGGTQNAVGLPYAYSWSGPGGFTSASDDISGLSSGTYTVTVTDANGCTISQSIVIDQPNTLGQTGAIGAVNCFGGNDGVINVDVFGGTLPYSYAWSGPSSYSATTEDISGLPFGSYTLTVTDGNNCVSTAVYNVTQPAAALSLSTTAVDVACKGDATGSIDLTTAGGTPGYTYSWANTSGVNLPYFSEDLANITEDTYTVVVTDANGCQETTSQVVTEPANYISTTPVLVDILCFGDATGSIDPVIAGGTPGYTYSWSNGATSATNNNLSAGTYDLLLTDNNGCTENYSYTLVEPVSGLTLTLTGTDIDCFGASTGAIATNVGGGTPEYSYLWSNGSTTPDISDVPAGNYSVTVTDDHGCTISDNLTLNEPAAPLVLSAVVTDVDCYGNNNGAVDLTITGGTGPYEQLWSNSATFVMVDTTEDISNQYSDSYTVLVTDNNGCTETLTSVINEPAEPLAITGVVDDANCFGLNDGAIDATVTGGTTAYNYSWSSGATTEDLVAILAGSYTLTVTDLNGCVESATFEVDEPNAPLSIVTFVTDVDCNGDNTGILESEVSGGTIPYTYAWSNGETIPEITDLLAGVYTLTVTDAQGCTAFTGATVNEPPALVVTPIITDASCYGFDDGQIVLNISGGVQPYYFYWGNQNEILLNNPSETLDGLTANDYFIRVRDENGCVNEQIVTVGEPNPYEATYIVTDVDCFGSATGAIDLTYSGGTAPYATLWSDGQATEDAVNLVAGVYTFTGTDTQGCVLTDEIYVDEPDEIKISYTIDPVSCIDQTDASIFVTPYGGTMPYSFDWSNGTTDQNATDLAPGFYTLTITDDNTCVQSFDFEIMINPEECLNIPNTITPNGDNYNDTWFIENLDLYPNAMVKIFNKWGNEIFSSEGAYEPWDGTHNGNPLPSSVYYYIIRLNNPDQNEYTGTITIVR